MQRNRTLWVGLAALLLGLTAAPAGAQVRASRALQPAPATLPTPLPAGTPRLLGQVTRVVDADTYDVVTARGPVRVRLLGVDAPERSQPFGAEAADSVARWLRGHGVWLEAQGPDLYGRTLARLWRRPAAFAGGPALALDSVLVARGWAWADAPGAAPAARAAEQRRAQDAGRGLWRCGTTEPVRPAVWRAFSKPEKLAHWGRCAW